MHRKLAVIIILSILLVGCGLSIQPAGTTPHNVPVASPTLKENTPSAGATQATDKSSALQSSEANSSASDLPNKTALTPVPTEIGKTILMDPTPEPPNTQSTSLITDQDLTGFWHSAPDFSDGIKTYYKFYSFGDVDYVNSSGIKYMGHWRLDNDNILTFVHDYNDKNYNLPAGVYKIVYTADDPATGGPTIIIDSQKFWYLQQPRDVINGLPFYVDYYDVYFQYKDNQDKKVIISKKGSFGSERIIISYNADMFDFKISTVGYDEEHNWNCYYKDVVLSVNEVPAGNVIDYTTSLPEGQPFEAISFADSSGIYYSYILGYDVMGCSPYAHRVEILGNPVSQPVDITPGVTPKDESATAPTPIPSQGSDANLQAASPASTLPEQYPGFHPVVCGNLFLGGSTDGKWLSAYEITALIQGGERYRLYSSKGYLCEGTGSTVKKWGTTAFKNRLEITPDRTSALPEVYLSVAADWNPQPRSAKKINTDNGIYKQIVADILAEEGLPGVEPAIMQIYSVDFEGDGVNEVVIYAQNFVDRDLLDWNDDTQAALYHPDPSLPYPSYGNLKAGDYSLLFVRKIIGGTVKNIFIHKFVCLDTEHYETEGWISAPALSKIQMFADLNGDGKLEMIVGEIYDVGVSYRVYEINGAETAMVIGNGWGM